MSFWPVILKSTTSQGIVRRTYDIWLSSGPCSLTVLIVHLFRTFRKNNLFVLNQNNPLSLPRGCEEHRKGVRGLICITAAFLMTRLMSRSIWTYLWIILNLPNHLFLILPLKTKPPSPFIKGSKKQYGKAGVTPRARFLSGTLDKF
jgi:hypothetical protein